MHKICKNCKLQETRNCKKVKVSTGIAFDKRPFTMYEYPGEKDSCGYFKEKEEDIE